MNIPVEQVMHAVLFMLGLVVVMIPIIYSITSKKSPFTDYENSMIYCTYRRCLVDGFEPQLLEDHKVKLIDQYKKTDKPGFIHVELRMMCKNTCHTDNLEVSMEINIQDKLDFYVTELDESNILEYKKIDYS